MMDSTKGIRGFWSDGKSSLSQEVELRLNSQILTVVLLSEDGPNKEVLLSIPLESVKISSRLGNSTRYLYFPDGQTFESKDNEGIDQLARLSQSTRQNGRLSSIPYLLETRWRYVFVALALLGVFSFWFATSGVPLTAKVLASALPESFVKKAGEETLAFLDQEFMEPSQLTEARKQELRSHFQPLLDDYSNYQFNLVFRHSHEMGANAFALPDGTIIFTDDIVNLSQHNDELLAVMAHEVGHVVYQHGMRNVVQGSLVGIIFMLVTNDASMASEIFLSLPLVLTQLGYSRDFENEADDFALAYLKESGIDTEHFIRLMARIDSTHCEAEHSSEVDSPSSCQHEHNWEGYLSTHPSMEERTEKFSTAQ